MKKLRRSPPSSREAASRHVVVDVSHPDVAGGAEKKDIARRAYEIYESRGGTDGADLDDWLQAERELQQLEVRS